MQKERINVFYYPEMVASGPTLKKAIFLFDEIHFMDRPAFTFTGGGLIGAASPMREMEGAFRSVVFPFLYTLLRAARLRGNFYKKSTPILMIRFF
jgi:hypothetical protein